MIWELVAIWAIVLAALVWFVREEMAKRDMSAARLAPARGAVASHDSASHAQAVVQNSTFDAAAARRQFIAALARMDD